MSSHPPTGWRDKEDCAFGNGWQSRAALASRSVMTDDEVIAEFRAADALLEGHFILSSGLRSPRYLQCARVLMDPRRAERLCVELPSRIPSALRAKIRAVVSPAMGGVFGGYDMASTLVVAPLLVTRHNGAYAMGWGLLLE